MRSDWSIIRNGNTKRFKNRACVISVQNKLLIRAKSGYKEKPCQKIQISLGQTRESSDELRKHCPATLCINTTLC